MTDSIRLLPHRFDVADVQRELAKTSAWNAYRLRTEQYAHSDIDDIWVRYNPWENFHGDPVAFNGPHESVWYPEAEEIPSVRTLVFDVMRAVEGEHLGGVLITRIPPHGCVKPHVDSGWHARHYGKFAVQIESTDEQAFCFKDARLSALPGELYTFDNSRQHWVTNDSHEQRITLIICIRGSKYAV